MKQKVSKNLDISILYKLFCKSPTSNMHRFIWAHMPYINEIFSKTARYGEMEISVKLQDTLVMITMYVKAGASWGDFLISLFYFFFHYFFNKNELLVTVPYYVLIFSFS